MFRRPITIKVEVDATEELTSIDNSLHVVSSGSETIANTSWATKEDAESYDGICYAELSSALANVIEGRPLMEGFDLAAPDFKNTLGRAS